MVGFVRLWDLNDGWFCYIVPLQDFKDGSFFFFLLRDLNDGRLCLVTGTRPVLFSYEISMTVGFLCSFTRFRRWSVLFCTRFQRRLAWLWDFNDGQFCFVLLREFNNGRNLWKKVQNFNGHFYFFTRSQWRSVLFSYEISMTVGFVPLFLYKISVTVSFVALWNFNDGRFCSVMRSQWR